MRKISKSLKETEKIASLLAGKIMKGGNRKGALAIAFFGDLGSGKTTFIKFLGKALKVRNRVASPTFTIMKKYPFFAKASQGKQILNSKLVHIDAYRLDGEKSLRALDWKNLVKNKNNVIAIEWPERIKKAVPRGAIKVKLAHVAPTVRSIDIRWPK